MKTKNIISIAFGASALGLISYGLAASAYYKNLRDDFHDQTTKAFEHGSFDITSPDSVTLQDENHDALMTLRFAADGEFFIKTHGEIAITREAYNAAPNMGCRAAEQKAKPWEIEETIASTLFIPSVLWMKSYSTNERNKAQQFIANHCQEQALP